MTDTASAPITGPHLTPMFATGAQDALAPSTEPHPSPIFDTGPHPDPLQAVGAPQAFSELENADNDTFLREHREPVVVLAPSVVVPGTFQFVRRWRFALIVLGVWVVSAIVGLGLYYWWYTALDKTVPVLGILLYVAACMVASLLVSLVANRPQVTALAIAVMAAPLAYTAAAAILHGAYYFEWIARPAIG